MSVCVVATYPWQSIAKREGLDPPGAIVVSDTRITYNGKPGPWMVAKQSMVAPNILICYTSSHAEATSLALKQSHGLRDTKKIGRQFVEVHARHGGFTELIAVVWRGRGVPQALELMPPEYRPRARSGIIGIGDRAVLTWFQENFRHEMPEPPLPADIDKMAESWQRQFGTPFTLPPPRLPLESAALEVVAATAVGIEEAGGPTVALPAIAWTVSGGEVHHVPVTSSEDLNTWKDLTVKREAAKLAKPVPAVTAEYTKRRTALQLFP